MPRGPIAVPPVSNFLNLGLFQGGAFVDTIGINVNQILGFPDAVVCNAGVVWLVHLDAFYHAASPPGIRDGLKSLREGGTLPRFDGRLVSIQENNEFRTPGNEAAGNLPSGRKDFILFWRLRRVMAKSRQVYVWHALMVMGYWGGLNPDVMGTKKYNPKLTMPVQSPGESCKEG
ncbi:hypothetical protein POM88_036197 [Heracleum sosnowskyi]|uniref:Uncharacterized protein n=1 Tax=Heracleum sosnowskyi TaxID=360622 RepID=A0AAD8HQ18_9APIA|nr:hypothetical protein POM88_036197 [Heracleum sosnowskyi]